MRICSITFILVFLAGCSSQVAQVDSLNSPLIEAARFYVPLYADGNYNNQRQIGSGKLVASQIAAALEARVHDVTLGTREESLNTALISAQQHQARYLVYATILDWQTNATQMADIEDKLAVKVQIIDVASQVVVDAAVLRNSTGFFTTDKVPSPQLLASPVGDYVAGLFDRSGELREDLLAPDPKAFHPACAPVGKGPCS